MKHLKQLFTLRLVFVCVGHSEGWMEVEKGGQKQSPTERGESNFCGTYQSINFLLWPLQVILCLWGKSEAPLVGIVNCNLQIWHLGCSALQDLLAFLWWEVVNSSVGGWEAAPLTLAIFDIKDATDLLNHSGPSGPQKSSSSSVVKCMLAKCVMSSSIGREWDLD